MKMRRVGTTQKYNSFTKIPDFNIEKSDFIKVDDENVKNY